MQGQQLWAVRLVENMRGVWSGVFRAGQRGVQGLGRSPGLRSCRFFLLPRGSSPAGFLHFLCYGRSFYSIFSSL